MSRPAVQVNLILCFSQNLDENAVAQGHCTPFLPAAPPPGPGQLDQYRSEGQLEGTSTAEGASITGGGDKDPSQQGGP